MTELAGFPPCMALLDCETTGGKATRDRMTEVAVIRVEHGVVVDRWQTLLDPERAIAPWITRLTGIDDNTVHGAPVFADIADELYARLADAVLVAHNARFDYGFLKNAFRRAGMDYRTRPLCSVKLSRKLFPGVKGHGLDALINRHGLQVQSRHRAMGDADAVLQFFHHVAQAFAEEDIRAVCDGLLQRATLPAHVQESDVDRLSAAPGVYRFYADNGHLLYVGKSVSIRDRVLSHFAGDHAQRRGLELCQRIAHIDFTRTPSDFGAQLLENHEIKTLSPQFNRRQTRVQKLYQFAVSMPEDGYPRITLVQADTRSADTITQRFGLFRTRRQAEEQLRKLADVYGLCHRLAGLQKTGSGACFARQLRRCTGACCGEEPADIYRLRVDAAMTTLKNRAWPWDGPVLVREQGIDQGDTQYHVVDQWLYFGAVRDEQDVHDIMDQPDAPFFDRDTYRILIRFLLSPAQLAQNRLQILPLRDTLVPT
ncbi:MAG TPA: exonuclease [Gammaproteobacteria bacterium]|nr:exonuclease [Gammaproteobacteria bacterium]